ncbi:MAG: hypothetical protein PQ612_05870 [Rickettsiales bacterium]|nr:hypothetical protein [Pseudomonadota bacterium]MDA0966850.1 hypothetical protein [Pseudomonadota bacterium]MDG4543525.1 hypothetical protein [Rickettsiales bacterium]MDG4545673.1 hypothetical protein [Rickettsiales bacterium]MDG4547554.1 hypothetical protein [Rickettsiales bacterium]
MSKIDEITGEVKSDDNESNDSARSFTLFLATLEDGELNSELSQGLRQLSKKMNEHCINYGSKAKGKIKIEIDLILEKGCFDIRSKFKVTEPEAPRLRSIAWADKSYNLLPNNPRQNDMFRDVNVRKIKTI